MVTMTGSIGSVTITGHANVTVSAMTQMTGIIGSLRATWGEVVPDEDSSYTTITPSQNANWEPIEYTTIG